MVKNPILIFFFYIIVPGIFEEKKKRKSKAKDQQLRDKLEAALEEVVTAVVVPYDWLGDEGLIKGGDVTLLDTAPFADGRRAPQIHPSKDPLLSVSSPHVLWMLFFSICIFTPTLAGHFLWRYHKSLAESWHASGYFPSALFWRQFAVPMSLLLFIAYVTFFFFSSIFISILGALEMWPFRVPWLAALGNV
jgi:hypothetical protein